MSYINCYAKRIKFDDRIDLEFFGRLCDTYISENENTRYKAIAFWYYQHDDDLINDEIITYIKMISVVDWINFKKWCITMNVTVHLKKKEIDHNKIWWPCLIECIIPNDNEQYVWLKMRLID